MAIKQYKPTTPSMRFTALSDFSEITESKPEKRLVKRLKKTAGRNSRGRVTSRRRGGGHKRRYRMIDFKRRKLGVPARVASIEYDPNRSARIALLVYRDGDKRYILAPRGLEVGMTVISDESTEPQVGNSMLLQNIPQGVQIHNIELEPGRGAQLCRGAGSSATIQAKEGKFALISLPSGEVRRVLCACRATIGQVGNLDHSAQSLGKAGRNRWLGRRPKVRGVAMNPVAHPMGGGEGRSGGGRHPCSPTGKLAKGGRTRKRNKASNKLIVRNRKAASGR